MAGRSSLVATRKQEAELRALSRSDVRGEADRARAILLILQGWTSPELNDIERTWRDSKRHHLAHHTFTGAADLTNALHGAVRGLNKERQTSHPCGNLNKAA